MINGENTREYIWALDKKGKVDAIYYAEFDAIKVFNEGNNWNTVLENGLLIWER